jgi:light-regulated signal transduction histidine kinase (bacteriophytochrome)
MDKEQKLRRILTITLMTLAGLFCVAGVMPPLLGHRPFGVVYALMGAVVALLTKTIADRQRMQRELMNLNAELEQRVKERTAQLDAANRELEAFSYSVAHDLRNPLQQLSGFVDLLEGHAKKTYDRDGAEYLDHIKQAVSAMSGLIDDLLDFSRAERGGLTKSLVSVEELVAETRNELRHQTEGRDILWKLGPLPKVYADSGLLRIAMVNLLSNAIKFSRCRSQAEIEIGSIVHEKDIAIYVRDNGVGFDMKQADKLFGVFQRLHTKHEFEGSGIGLANVQRIIHRHGGRAWAEGHVGAGATFWFSLPRTADAETQEQVKAQVDQ